METKIINRYSIIGLSILMGLLLLFSCTKEDFTRTTDTTPNINSFLADQPDYSLFSEAIQQAGAASYLDAWGTYTVFAPNNAAMTAFLSSEGKSSVSDLSEEEVKDLVNLHIVQDTVSTATFRDGKIARNSVYGMFITTAVENVNGESNYILNKESRIVMANVRAGNGWIHGVDKVFTKVTHTVMDAIADDPDLRIFAEGLTLTGLDALLQVRKDSVYFSVLAVSNEAFAQIGVHSIADLKDKYSQTGNPSNPEDSLYMHMAYHVLPGLKYVSDLTFSSSHTTEVPREVLLVKVDGEKVLLNEEEWLGELEEGIEIDRPASDNTSVNGVLHYLKGDVYIKSRSPFALYWDPADQPEIRVSGAYGRADLTIPKDFLSDIVWGGADNRTIEYGLNGDAVNGDILNMYIRNNSATIPWVEFKTPVLVRGRYKVWVAHRRNGDSPGNTIDTYINGQKLSRSFDTYNYLPAGLSDRELEALGYKRYLNSTTRNFPMKMVGIVDIETTDRQTIRFETNTNVRAQIWLDMIHFIPIDQEQIYPLFNTDGSMVYPEQP